MGKKSKSREVKERHAIDYVPNPEDEGDTKFARALGSGDFHTRHQGLQALALWLQRKHDVSDVAVAKIWKGVFYCFWHSDKAHVQEDLAKQLADIFPGLNEQVAELYFKVFLQTMRRDWIRIDRLRLDKFMMMIRKFFNKLFVCMGEQKWEKEYVARYTKVIQQNAFVADDSVRPVGFSLHIADIFLSELRSAAAESDAPLPSARLSTLLSPFITALAATRQPALVQRIQGSVFEALVNDLIDDPDSSPFRLCKTQALADKLFGAGAAEEVRARNRNALYELADTFERAGAARERAAEEAAAQPARKKARTAPKNGNVTVGVARTAEPGEAAPTGPLAKALKKRKRGTSIGAAAAETAEPQAAGRQVDSAGKANGKKNGKRRQSAPADLAGAALTTPTTPPNGGTGVKANGGSEADMLTPTATAALARATAAVHAASAKRRITFNLKQNVVHQIGKPLPPAELRTPPSAKPNGPALKKVSSLPVPRSEPPAKKKLTFDAKAKARKRASDFF